MKTGIKLLAIGLLLSSSVFAGTPAKSHRSKAPLKSTMIMFSPLRAKKGIDVRIRNLVPGQEIVRIYDGDGNYYWHDVSKAKAFEKGYILNQLAEGDYTVEVTLNKTRVEKRLIHVYDEGENKCVKIEKVM